ncbi:aromatic ring-hydroxylating oxygenase subunit alpha [Breznakiella homolactica]|uniref:Aromatic ring-hydroxylating dioxygenase subunit alpha n=1 Tax=Breznakiella homolactica TaxID=2798577 RepID=A0A7T7XPS2_9SPIR|nr:aromatic ring-hydroxylating dioxygenase subunit alpha [Breznakiella homolactica]QQO10223.1 aromatic ring-hydroxylating dioxygenase subunit alpha [Breznakiella homolactica]
MIRNQWYGVLDSDEVKKGKPLGVTRLGERLVFWRDSKGQIICMKDVCAHRGTSLAAGTVCTDREAVQCPFHGFEYDSSGRCRLIPANGKTAPVPQNFHVEAYPSRESQGFIYIWWGEHREEYPNVPRFQNLAEKEFSYTLITDTWPVHYSRTIENQLDLVHLPFVHYNTIGRGNRTLVNGPIEQIRGNEILFWPRNTEDHGEKPLKQADFPAPDESSQHIHFIFPNLWQNWIAPSLRVAIVFAPIDGNHTRIYLRTYQKFIRIPVLKKLADLVMYRFSLKILRQDRRVVVTQLPDSSEKELSENLIRGDLPIISYRRMRESLKNSV